MGCFDFSILPWKNNTSEYLTLLESTRGHWQICLKLRNCANPGYSRVFERKILWASLEKLSQKSIKTIASGGPGADLRLYVLLNYSTRKMHVYLSPPAQMTHPKSLNLCTVCRQVEK
jgi:hypothetical protein